MRRLPQRGGHGDPNWGQKPMSVRTPLCLSPVQQCNSRAVDEREKKRKKNQKKKLSFADGRVLQTVPWTQKSAKFVLPIGFGLAASVPAFAMWWQMSKLK